LLGFYGGNSSGGGYGGSYSTGGSGSGGPDWWGS